MENITRSQLRHSTPIGIGGRTKPVSPDYIVGLTDGEGCFYVLVKPPYNQQGGAIIQLSFLIKVKEEDKIILDKVRDSMECGAVYFQKEKRINHSQCYRYTVNSHRDIFKKIIPFFNQYPLQSVSKQKNFKIFCQIVQLVKDGEHHAKSGVEKIRELKSQMNHRTGLA